MTGQPAAQLSRHVIDGVRFTDSETMATVYVSKSYIEDMGFTEYPVTDELEISFGIIKVYSIRGLEFEKACELKQTRVASFGSNCTAVISQSINDACKVLAGGTFVDDEEKWISDKKARPPFLLIYFRESAPRILRGGYRQERDSNIYTYDAFPEGKIEIRNWENDVALRINTALTVHLSTLKKQVDIVPIDRRVFGTTQQGKTLFDVKTTMQVGVYAPSVKSTDDIAKPLNEAENLHAVLTKDSIRHFYSALNEEDRLKQFLGYFWFIERFTNSTFNSLNYERNAKELFNIHHRIEKSAAAYFSTVIDEAKNLAQRFLWCAMTTWSQIDDQDVISFKRIKKVRDRLAHGKHINEPDLPVEKAKTLGLKLLGTKET